MRARSKSTIASGAFAVRAVLERRERVVVTFELALRLRDAQQAQPVLGVRGENLAVLGDRLLPAPLLERELGGVRDGRRRLAFLRTERPGREPMPPRIQ